MLTSKAKILYGICGLLIGATATSKYMKRKSITTMNMDEMNYYYHPIIKDSGIPPRELNDTKIQIPKFMKLYEKKQGSFLDIEYNDSYLIPDTEVYKDVKGFLTGTDFAQEDLKKFSEDIVKIRLPKFEALAIPAPASSSYRFASCRKTLEKVYYNKFVDNFDLKELSYLPIAIINNLEGTKILIPYPPFIPYFKLIKDPNETANRTKIMEKITENIPSAQMLFENNKTKKSCNSACNGEVIGRKSNEKDNEIDPRKY